MCPSGRVGKASSTGVAMNERSTMPNEWCRLNQVAMINMGARVKAVRSQGHVTEWPNMGMDHVLIHVQRNLKHSHSA